MKPAWKFAFLPLFTTLGACQAPAGPGAPPRQVRSVGYGSVTVYPDYAELTVDADFTRPKLKDAVAEVQAVVDQVLVLSKRYAPGPNEVRVSSTSSNKEFDYVKGKEVFLGFNSSQSVTVRVNDLRRLSPFLEELLATRISRIKDLGYGHSRADSLHREAAALALTDATKTADKMCTALHVRRGAVLEASDGSNSESSDGWDRPRTNIQLYSKGFGGRGFKTSPELLRFSSTCNLASALE
ncbi:SIMPL domain-containing protein [Hymenobacter properus]|uniref:SIMPL domain-containing protein n=1 Tax=Hymenobacter properus TaxID=2791026 RepID=A0A931BJ75_9BACT|nr:SIMPL domain-containing protein [Hymenobacter properus]MBF9141198.1 SIMPL domain-containing protein [Hymenobacter properus]MBR7720007.1 SIMPL domain-containing protein [Microvirga sp. SRT04]